MSAPGPDRTATLVCLPGAGGSARRYLRWRDRLGSGVRLVPLDLPGRGLARRQPACRSLEAAAAALLPAVRDLGRYVVFGHSLGALLGYELTRQACAAGSPPQFLVAAACRAPDDCAPALREGVAEPDDDRFAAGLARLGVLAPEQAGTPMARMFLPQLRSDLALATRYAPGGAAGPGRLPVDVLAWYGADDPLVPGEAAERWRHHTSGACTVEGFPGGHDFPQERETETVDALRACVRQCR